MLTHGTVDWAAIVTEHEPMLRAYLRKCSGSWDVDDYLQETWVAAVNAWDRYDASRPLEAWLKGIARRKLSDARRKAFNHFRWFGRRKYFDHGELMEIERTDPYAPDDDERREMLWDAVRAERAVIVETAPDRLPVFDLIIRGDKNREIARSLGVAKRDEWQIATQRFQTMKRVARRVSAAMKEKKRNEFPNKVLA